MFFQCLNCDYKKQLSAQQSQKFAGKNVSCPKCKKSTRVPEEIQSAGSRWLIFDGKTEHGPIGDKEISRQLSEGWILTTFLVKHDELTDGVWKPVMEVNEVARKMPPRLIADNNAAPLLSQSDRISLNNSPKMLDAPRRHSRLTGLPASTENLLGGLGFLVVLILIAVAVFSPGGAYQKTNDSYNDSIRESMRRTNDTFNKELRRSMRETQRAYDDALRGY